VLRGLHLQHPDDQGKLITVLRGAIFDVAADVRRGSPTFGRWCAATLTAESAQQLWIPPGFAHGFLVTGGEAVVMYKCTAPYRPSSELTIAWDDPDLGVEWPLEAPPVLSPRDAQAPRLVEVPPGRLPVHAPLAATVHA
jgi:dTDP-4-dehydrorhamnose 3,5-epimerase